MLETTHGTRIKRQQGYTLTEYGCGDHPESIYYIKDRDGNVIGRNYIIPRKGHKDAIKWFAETIDDITRS